MTNDPTTPTHPALDEFDATMRQIRSRLAALVDKNERLTQSVEAIHAGVAAVAISVGFALAVLGESK